MVEVAVGEHQGRIWLTLRVQGHEEFRSGKPLQQVHPVGDAGGAARIGPAGPDVVPGGPGGAAARHEAAVTVQDDAVATIGHGLEQALLVAARLSQQGQGLIGVDGQNHRVEPFRATAGMQGRAIGATLDAGDRLVEANFSPEVGGERLDISTAAARDRAPGWLHVDFKQAVVAIEADEGGGRIVRHLARRRRPDRGGLGQQMQVAEAVAVFAVVQVAAQ